VPFKSDAQRKLCYVLKGKGQAGSWDCAEWSEATGDKKLPEHVEDQTEKKALGITNKLKGGVGDNKNPAELDRSELNSGIKEEKEHTNDTDVATEIAVDHLTEEPKYYSKMKKVEKRSAMHIIQPSKFAELLAKVAAARPGLWANIRAKKKRGETAATPGDEDYPDSKNWDKVTAISEKKAQCWEGYERVPGTKALTSGSCRPKGKKKEDKSAAAWETSEGKNPEGGLNDKGRASLKAQGHDIKRPQPEGGARKDSFCARMGGMKAKLTSSETANDPDSRINKALRKWKCGSDMVEKQAIAALFKTLGQGALRAMSKAPMTTAAVGIGGAGAYEATRPTNKLIPQILPNATGAAPPTPPLNEKTGYVIAALAKLAVDQAGGSYLNAQNTINAQRVAQIKADAERVRIASGAPKPSGNGTYRYSGTVFPNRVENAQHSFTPPAAQGQGEFLRQPVQAPSMKGDTTPTFNNPTPPTSNNTFAPSTAKPTNPPPANRWKPIDISGDRRRKEKEMGWAPNSMDQGGSRYGENGPRSAELVKQYGPTGAPSKPATPTSLTQAPVANASKAPSNTYATSRFSSTPPSWATQGWNPKL